VDTHSAFEDGIAALSLGSGCGMRFSRVVRDGKGSAPAGEAAAEGDGGADSPRTGQSRLDPGVGEAGGEEQATSPCDEATLWLPRRSLIVFSGASRYAWAHAIPMRKGDVRVGGHWVPRDRRVSLTFRRILRAARGCSCAHPHLCDSQGGVAVALPTRLQAQAREVD
jgi:alkylated DNA repair protein alkB family protein 8